MINRFGLELADWLTLLDEAGAVITGAETKHGVSRQGIIDAAVALAEAMQKLHPEHLVLLDFPKSGGERITIADRAAVARVESEQWPRAVI